MIVDGKQLRPIWLDADGETVCVIDQRQLPHEFEVLRLGTVDDIIFAIREMVVRGAPLIGVTAAYGVYLALINESEPLAAACDRIRAARPTAVNLVWAVDRMAAVVAAPGTRRQRADRARKAAAEIAEEEALNCRLIGDHGVDADRGDPERQSQGPVNILTHCNAGWLACVEYGTATAPIYAAFERGIDVHVWVDETRPLNQGARLTAWELGKHGIAHTVIADNAGGHLMQHGRVDLVIVGTDRTTHTGDVANKIGTYLKALAANDNGVPFYVALPSSTFDWQHHRRGRPTSPSKSGIPDEIRYRPGPHRRQDPGRVLSPRQQSPAANFAFDVTPARLVTGFITERGICRATRSRYPAAVSRKKRA